MNEIDSLEKSGFIHMVNFGLIQFVFQRSFILTFSRGDVKSQS